MIKKVLLTVHATFIRFFKSFTIFFIDLSIPQTFDELFKNLLTTGVSSCTFSCSESHLFKLLLDHVIRSSSCSTVFSNKLVISFKLSVNSYFSSPSLCCHAALRWVRCLIMSVLHSLQEHASGFHDLINFINLPKEFLYFILFGTSSQIFGPIYLSGCKP